MVEVEEGRRLQNRNQKYSGGLNVPKSVPNAGFNDGRDNAVVVRRYKKIQKTGEKDDGTSGK